jgi:uncharacterized protein YuzE
MKVKYDKEQDILYFKLNNSPIFESDEDKKGVIIDYSAEGKVVGIEILNVADNVGKPNSVEYEFAE